MPKFQYGLAIRDSFRLVFNNLYVLVPQLLVSLISLLFVPVYSNNIFILDASTGAMNFNSNFILPFILVLAVSVILTFISYGWTLALIGTIVKSGKADLLNEFKSGLRKGWAYFLIMLIALLIFFAGAVIFTILFVLIWILFSFAAILGMLLAILSAIGLIIAIVVFVLAFMYTTPLVALESFGAVKLVKLSFSHFRNNKAHSLALFFILILFGIAASLIYYTISFMLIGSISSEAIVIYMTENPIKYSILSFFSALPNLLFMAWSFAFLAIAYVRKKSKK